MMKGLLVAGFAGVMLLAGCASPTDDMPKSAPIDAPQSSNGIDGKALFMANCATCHNPLKDATGPALKGSQARWKGDTARMDAFIHNPAAMMQTDPYAKELGTKWGGVIMTAFPSLTSQQIAAIMNYADHGY